MSEEILLDNFVGTNGTSIASHVADSGATWALNPGYFGTAEIQSNRLRGTSSGAIFNSSVISPVANVLCRGRFYVVSTGSGNWAGITARANTGGSGTFYLALLTDTGNVQLYRFKDGGAAQIGSTSAQSITIGQSYDLELEVTGVGASVSLIVRFGGVAVITQSDSSSDRIAVVGRSGVAFSNTGGIDIESTSVDVLGTFILPADARVKLSPFNWRTERTAVDPWPVAVTNNVGAYAEAGFSGTSISALVDVRALAGADSSEYPYLRKAVDGGSASQFQLTSSSGVVPLSSGLSAGTHTHRLGFDFAKGGPDRWDTPVSAVRLVGFQVDDGETGGSVTALPKRCLVLGDSIVEAVWDDTSYATGTTSTTIGTLIPQHFGWEFGKVAFQHQGFTVGGVGNVPPLFTDGDATNTAWNQYSDGHSRLTGGLLSPAPDFILSEHGENDAAEDDADLAARIVLFLEAARAAAPDAIIFEIIPSKQTKRSAINDAVVDYKAAHPDDDRVIAIDVNEDITATPGNTIADLIHLTEAGQEDWAGKIIPRISAHLAPSGNARSMGLILGLGLGLGFGGGFGSSPTPPPASVPTISVAPTITLGANNPPLLGDTVTCSQGTWDANGSTIAEYIYQWQRYNGSDFADIPGAIFADYEISADEWPVVLGNNAIRCRVTAQSDSGDSAPATSDNTASPAPRVQVSGAGYGAVNGIYTYRYTSGTGMRYNLEGQSSNEDFYALRVSTDGGAHWKLTDGSGNEAYVSTDTSVHPWQATWTAVDTETGAPVPTFTLV